MQFECPLPLRRYASLQMGHGSGGRMTQELIEHLFVPAFGHADQASMDAALFELRAGGTLAITTDSFVVNPLIFPGGDIGSLAIHGTINDLAVSGARPMYFTAGFILEEGLAMETLVMVVQSMAEAARRCGVSVIAGDTKVVERGRCDGLYINTTGIGIMHDGVHLGPQYLKPGDVLLVNGPLGNHGMAILAKRNNLTFEPPLESDSAPLHDIIEEVLAEYPQVHAMRDLTRGGLAAAVNEFAGSANLGITLYEQAIPIESVVANACEVLGFDPLTIANEGRFIAIVPKEIAESVLAAMKALRDGHGAAIIGEVTSEHTGIVVGRNAFGGERVIPMPAGELLPRIC